MSRAKEWRTARVLWIGAIVGTVATLFRMATQSPTPSGIQVVAQVVGGGFGGAFLAMLLSVIRTWLLKADPPEIVAAEPPAKAPVPAAMPPRSPSRITVGCHRIGIVAALLVAVFVGVFVAMGVYDDVQWRGWTQRSRNGVGIGILVTAGSAALVYAAMRLVGWIINGFVLGERR